MRKLEISPETARCAFAQDVTEMRSFKQILSMALLLPFNELTLRRNPFWRIEKTECRGTLKSAKRVGLYRA